MTDSPRLPGNPNLRPVALLGAMPAERPPRSGPPVTLHRVTSSDSAVPLNRVLSSSQILPSAMQHALSPREQCLRQIQSSILDLPDLTSINVANSVLGTAEPRPTSRPASSLRSNADNSQPPANKTTSIGGMVPDPAAPVPAGSIGVPPKPDAQEPPPTMNGEQPLSSSHLHGADLLSTRQENALVVNRTGSFGDLHSLNVANSVVGTAEPRQGSPMGILNRDDRSMAAHKATTEIQAAVDEPKTVRTCPRSQLSEPPPACCAPSTIGVANGPTQEMRAPAVAQVPSQSDYNSGTVCENNQTQGLSLIHI
eukprot:TRINITY_DN9699_c0_g1_i2.p1 TRINITY_DN9699_c0_g1~~TRINITY_DN9699_c0_g1_i2.p1  ORF type:complete len:310 (+),score=39.63 TRINITY_DN9699_c0_g1_i2:155-1084(+)